MKLETFFEKFDQFADAPDAVAKMRELVLELAVRGRLLSSGCPDPSDPSAAPFPIPSHWRWSSLSEAAEPCGQKKPDARFTYVDVGAIDNARGQITDAVQQLEAADAPSRARKLVRPGSVLYATVRPYLRNIAVFERQFTPPAIVSTAFAVLHPRSILDVRFLFFWLRSRPFQKEVTEKMKGVAYPAICDSEFWRCPLPLPPLAEQKRIVAKMDELMALCDRLEVQEQERETRHTALARASLARFADAPTPANLPFLFHPSYAIPPADLRESILTLAVQGKLVPQDPNDQPAGDMLKEIEAEKRRLADNGELKADKKAWVNSSPNPPLDIPESWCWVRLQDVFEISRGGSPRPAGDPRFFGGSIPWITVGEVTKDTGKYLTETATGLTEEGSQRSRFINPGDLLLTNSGATLGVPKISKIRGCMNDGVAVLRLFHSFDLNDFGYLYLTHQTPAFRNVNQGMGQPNLNTPIIAGWFFPLPPLAEQRRIVAKVGQLMALVDELETQLAASRATAQKLLAALVAELTTAS